MERLQSAKSVAGELQTRLSQQDIDTTPRLLKCIAEIIPLFGKLQSFKHPWNQKTIHALDQLHEAMESILTLIQNIQQLEQQNGSFDYGSLLIATRLLWRRQIEMYLALQLQDVLEKTYCPKTTSTSNVATAVGANTTANSGAVNGAPLPLTHSNLLLQTSISNSHCSNKQSNAFY